MRSKSRVSAAKDRENNQDRTDHRKRGGVSSGDRMCSADSLSSGESRREGSEVPGYSLQSDVARGYWAEAPESAPEAASDGVCEGDEVLNQAERFNRVTRLAVKTLEEILEEPLPLTNKDYARLLGIKKDAASSILSLALRADESKFRVQSMQGVMALLEEVRKLKQEEPDLALETTATVVPLLQ